MRKGRFFIGAVIIMAAVSYLVYAGIRETSVYYLTMAEFAAKKSALIGQPVRVSGRVQAGTMQWNPRTLDLRFAMDGIGETDGEAVPGSLSVQYNGILPDMLAEGRDVIVEGIYKADSTFVAHTILTSCPSKYEPEVPAS
jgi:cytochrome c-type biogenesis protein CcmE